VEPHALPRYCGRRQNKRFRRLQNGGRLGVQQIRLGRLHSLLLIVVYTIFAGSKVLSVTSAAWLTRGDLY
jgi:hypothetical protein